MIELPQELASLNIQPPWNEDYPYQRMVLVGDGQFYPLLSIHGYGIYNSYKRHIAAVGTRKASKSVAIANKCVRHLWETNGAVAAVVCRSIKIAKIGVWRDLTNFVLPGWLAMDCGMKIVKQGVDPVSKMEYIRVTNMHGTISEVQLHSCKYAFAAEEQFKGGRFSWAWISEADQFEDRILFDILTDQLRIIGLPYEQHQIICDFNWPENGPESYLFEIFEGGKDPESKFYRDNYHDEFELRKFSMLDNPFLDQREKDDLRRKYAHDSVKSKRFYNNPDGEWVRDQSAGHFDETFMSNIHIRGSANGINRADWEVITPDKDARFIITGTDTGDLNHATAFLCPRVDIRDEVVYEIFDEVASIDERTSVRSFAEKVQEKILFWTKWMMVTYGFSNPPEWKHWADSSLFEFNAGACNNDAQIFWDASCGGEDKEGEEIEIGSKKIIVPPIRMRPVVKGKGSINARIGMAKRLFHDNRLYFSAHCRWNIAWARYLKKGRAKNQPVSDGSKQFKHMFDAATYAIGAEIPNEMDFDDTPSVATGIITT